MNLFCVAEHGFVSLKKNCLGGCFFHLLAAYSVKTGSEIPAHCGLTPIR